MEQSPLAVELLTVLGQSEAAPTIEIGGGIALWVYSPHRSTNDIDAWWPAESDVSRAAITSAVDQVAASHHLEVRRRVQSGYESWDLQRGGKTIFAFQIARKNRRVEPPLASPWGGLQIESLRENIANKMTALVQRGAPRDFVDVATVLRSGLLTDSECWRLWMLKNPEIPLNLAKANVLKYLGGLEARRPLSSIVQPAEAEAARSVRETIRELCDGH